MAVRTREEVQGHLQQLAREQGLELSDPQFAAVLDKQDELAHYRSRFNIPVVGNMMDDPAVDPKSEAAYFVGNSLGLQPKTTQEMVKTEMDRWATEGLYGNYTRPEPWYSVEDLVTEQSARIVGANPIEVAIMNALTVNIHVALTTFYQPTKDRHVILIEDSAFPSDHYAVQSQIHWHGYSPESSMLLISPRKDEATWRTEDVVKIIEEKGDSIAFIWLPGIHYATGYVFDMEAITRAAHKKGCYVGFDLAHAVGNIEMHLHDWEVDVAAWCGYKYLNAGPGAVGGFFVHEKHAHNHNLPRLLGWWAHKRDTRMAMTNVLELQPGAAGFQISNPPVLLITCLKASLQIFRDASMEALCCKSRLLTGYMEILLEQNLMKQDQNPRTRVTILTPQDPKERGCQLSISCSTSTADVKKYLCKRGIIVDYREPNLIRVAPVPLYNTFSEVLRFYRVLCEAVNTL